jgi:amidohydrolase
MSEALKDEACAAVDRQGDALVELSRRIHAHPELRFEERQAAVWLADYLESLGFTVERSAYGLDTAFAAAIGSGRPRVALLCEYDALPEIGHACGHNVIAAAGAGAAAGLAPVIDRLGGSVRVLGTPAEEGGGGKVIMARAGAFDDVDVAMMIHPSGTDLLEIDALAITALQVEYSGRAAHAAAAPQHGINALDALVTAYNAIAQLRQHIAPGERVHGIITNGGQAPNIVPERAAGVFYVRSPTRVGLEALAKRVLECFRAGALATGAKLTVDKSGEDYEDLQTNQPLAAVYAANLKRLGREIGVSGKVTGSTDMGNVSHLVPSIHPMLQIAPPDVPLHTQEFCRWAASDRADRGVLDGAKAMAMTAIDFLSDPALQEAVRAAFETAHEGRGARDEGREGIAG